MKLAFQLNTHHLSLITVRARAKQDQYLADALHGVGSQRIADMADQTFAMSAIISQHPDLDELVALQSEIDFAQHRRGEPGFADHDDRMQMMRARSEGAPLRGCDWIHVRKS